MNRILLIGELGEVVRSLNECLVDKYTVQLCSKQLDNVQGMMKIVKPEMVVICQLGMEDSTPEIYQWLEKECKTIPVLVITTMTDWENCREYCTGKNFDRMFRPVFKNDLLDKCRKMLMHYEAPKEEAVVEKKKILIVDDSALVLRNLKELLGDEYKVYLSTSGEQALNIIPIKKPDLILLDYEMPGMDGKDIFEAILDDDSMKDIPVVFLTSIAKRKQIYAVLRSIPAGYILKPPTKERLLTTIEDVLNGKFVSEDE